MLPPGGKSWQESAGAAVALAAAEMPKTPNIAGDGAPYIVRQLDAYCSGARQNELMSAVAPMLSDAKMTDVAA